MIALALDVSGGGFSLTDLGALAVITSAIVAGAVQLIKAGPAWSKSVIQTARDETAAISAALEAERAGRLAAEQHTREVQARADSELRVQYDRAEGYRRQLMRAEIVPFDEAGAPGV